jgi:hypothetical protein
MSFFTGLMEYDDWASDQRKYKQQQKMLQTKLDLDVKEFELREKIYETGINQHNDKMVIETLKILQKGGTGLNTGLSLGTSGTGKKITMSNKKAIAELKGKWEVENETLFKLLANTNMQEGVGEQIVTTLEDAYKTYTGQGYANIPRKEVTRMLEQVVDSATESKPYEGLLQRLEKQNPGGMTDLMTGILSGFQNMVVQTMDVPGFKNPEKKSFDPEFFTKIRNSVDTELTRRYQTEIERLQITRTKLNNYLNTPVTDKESPDYGNLPNDLFAVEALKLVMGRIRKLEELKLGGKIDKGFLRSFYGTKNIYDNALKGQFSNYDFTGSNIMDETIPDKHFKLPSPTKENLDKTDLVGTGVLEYQEKMIEYLQKYGYFDKEYSPNSWFSKFGVEGSDKFADINSYIRSN